MISNSVRKDLYKNLGEVKNEEITERMVGEISDQIELCLTKMAAVVEIPLGWVCYIDIIKGEPHMRGYDSPLSAEAPVAGVQPAMNILT